MQQRWQIIWISLGRKKPLQIILTHKVGTRHYYSLQPRGLLPGPSFIQNPNFQVVGFDGTVIRTSVNVSILMHKGDGRHHQLFLPPTRYEGKCRSYECSSAKECYERNSPSQGLIFRHISIGEGPAFPWFRISENPAVDLVLGTCFMDICNCGIVLTEGLNCK